MQQCLGEFGRVRESSGEFGECGRVRESLVSLGEFGRVWESWEFWIAFDTDSEMSVFGKVFGRVWPNIQKSHFLRDFRYNSGRDWVNWKFTLEEI